MAARGTASTAAMSITAAIIVVMVLVVEIANSKLLLVQTHVKVCIASCIAFLVF